MKGKVILLMSETIGTGEPDLGVVVLESFLTVVKSRPLPYAVFCMHRGVLALTPKSPASLHLAELAEAGVKVLACKTCVDYYDVESDLQAGEVSSMGAFVDLAADHEVVTIC